MHISHITWMFTAIFTILKLTGHIDWSWWLVFAPIWGTFLMLLIINISCLLYLEWIKRNRPKA